MPQAAESLPGNNQKEFRNPYPRSWIDSLIDWIQGLPIPAWLFYAVALLVVALLNNIVFWLDGSLELGTFTPSNLFNAGFNVFPIALYHHLTVVAGRSIEVFRPVLGNMGQEQRLLEYRLTHVPRYIGWLAIVVGTGIAVPGVLADPASVGADKAIAVLPIIYQSIALSMTISSFLVLILRTFRQFRLVDDLHRKASNINLFELAPTHAFANLTARASIVLIILILLNILGTMVDQSNLDEIQLIFIAVMGILAVAMFSLPLLGMRNRLKDEKTRLLSEVSARLQQTIARIHDQVDSNRHENIGNLQVAMNVLIEERNLLMGISTLPWDPGTFKGFATSLFLPIFLWLVTRLLERLI